MFKSAVCPCNNLFLSNLLPPLLENASLGTYTEQSVMNSNCIKLLNLTLNQLPSYVEGLRMLMISLRMNTPHSSSMHLVH